MGFRDFSRLFTGAPVAVGFVSHLTLFRLLELFVFAFHSLAGALESPSKRGTSRYSSDPPPKRVTESVGEY
eukprot:3482541-Prymnesium_polylepis.1